MPGAYLRLTAFAIESAIRGVGAADKVVQRLPVLGNLRGRVLDTLLGPEDGFDYRPTTSPSPPPRR